MKKLIILLFLWNTANGQIEVGTTLGISNKAGIFNIQLGYANNNHHLYYNQFVHLTAASTVPDIIGFRYAYSIGSFEPSVGIEWHLLSNIPENDKHRGHQLGYGLAYKLYQSVIRAGVSGNVYYGSIGVFKIL